MNILLGYGAKNFLSFNEGIEVPLRLNSNCPEHISKNKKYTNIICVKGTNGSGKTNVLKILNFLSSFCCDSFNSKPDEEISCESFFNNNEQTDFYVDFLIDNTEFRYELSLNKKNILNETIFRKNKRITKILERKNNRIEYFISEYNDINIIKLRSNASIISTSNQYEIKSLDNIYKFFRSIFTNLKLDLYSSNLLNKLLNSKISKIYFDDNEYFSFAKEILYKSDLGINGVEIKKIETDNNESIYSPIFYHLRNEEKHSLNFSSQSNGTKALFNQLWMYKEALKNGGVLILDELDINLHPHILKLLINLFLDEKININNTQLIFTTHNTEIMDYLSKYRVFLVNKKDNESFGYRLDEISGDMIRNDRLISPLYNEGKLGGVPSL